MASIGKLCSNKMYHIKRYLLVLGLIIPIKCDHNLSLKIFKNTGNNFIPVENEVVEKVGANFTLLCDLVSSTKNENDYDFQLSWFKQSINNSNNNNTRNDVRFWHEYNTNELKKIGRKYYSIVGQGQVNKAEILFSPLKPDDGGRYICVSLKYGLHETVDIIIIDENERILKRPSHIMESMNKWNNEPIFCSSSMFQCLNGFCIIHHYICDGQKDCKDGSDESMELCNGDPCRDKLKCDDGRCIPTSWCCDHKVDPNCTINIRHKCCQLLSDSYEDLEVVTQTHYGARYLFISVCVMSVLFAVVLLLLVLSRVVIFAKKPGLQQNHHHSRTAGNRTNIEIIDIHNLSSSVRLHSCPFGMDIQRSNGDNFGVSDPLLLPPEFGRITGVDGNEQPPPYIDVVGGNLNEPPPPYTSTEVLNCEERQ